MHVHTLRAVPAPDAPGAPPGRVLWRCRRGMKELDVVLERFAGAALAHGCEAQRGAFERLLTLPDPVLAGYLLGGETPTEPQLAQLVRRILGEVD
ncbi:MAG: succinate dehydrogenase assembly factor 2 [Steroidobacteraceae bacterium]